MTGIRIIGWIVLIIILLWVYACYMERFGIYYPMDEVRESPADISLRYQEVNLTTEDGKNLEGWYLPGSNNRIVLFFSGNAGNRGYRLDKLRILHELNLSVLIVDYRGYGGSTGRPSEKGLFRDGKAMWEYASQELNYSPEQILLYGESLGGAVAFHVGAEKEVGGVIVEGTFSSAREVARDLIFFIPRFMVSDIYNSRTRAPQLDAPLLILHSREDEIIPYQHGKKLYEAAEEPKKLVPLQGSHNHAFLEDQQTYRKAMEDFLQDL